MRTNPGGKGANQAVAAARQGATVAMIGKVGNDAFGQELLGNLQSELIDTRLVSQVESSSGVAWISVDDSGENSIVVVAGANGLVVPDDVIRAEELISRCDVLLAQLETPVDAVLAAMRCARKHDVTTFLNPAPMIQPFDPRLYDVDVFCVNQTEAESLLGKQIEGRQQAERAAREFVARGSRIALVTLAAAGVAWAVRSKSYEIESSSMEAFAIQAVDATAAGDAFCGALAVSLARNLTLPTAIRVASSAGALAAARHGAQTSIPTSSEVDSFLASRAS
jgi:ribokinase